MCRLCTESIGALGFFSQLGEHSVHRRTADSESRCDSAHRFAAGVHPACQLGLGFVECLGSPNRLATCPTCFACRCSPFTAKFQFELR